MVLALGVDGGGTQTRCLVLDEQGQKIGFGVSGASKPDAVDPATGRANLRQVVSDACLSCGGAGAIDSAFLGMGGVVSAADVQVVREMLVGIGFRSSIPVGIDHDIRIALAGGTAGQPGIALIVGTGSSCYGRNAAGQSWRCGGWGYAVDDMGSGFYLGQQALIAVIRAADGRGAATSLTAPILDALGLSDVAEIMHRIYHPALDYRGIASLARVVVEMAEHDVIAQSIIERGCDELALMVRTTAERLGLTERVLIVPVGGLVRSSQYFEQALGRAIREVVAQPDIQLPVAPPVVGAALLALQQVGIDLSADVLAQIQPVV